MKKICAVVLMSLMVLAVFCSCGQPDIESIIMTNSDVTMTVGNTTTLSFVVNPQNASQKGLTWSSSNEGVATVDDGNVKAVSEGTATITVMTPKGIKATCNVTVGEVEVQAITLSASSSSIKVGKTTQIEAKVTPATANSDDLDWSSSNADIASVDSNGNVTGLKAGSTTITCTAPNGKRATCNITVTAKAKKSATAKKSTKNNSTTVVVLDPNYIGRTYSSEFVFYDSSWRKLSSYEVSGLSSSTIQKAINEIYARNGYAFKTPSIRAYYEATSWYRVNPNFTTSDFNSIEQYNLALLEKYR